MAATAKRTGVFRNHGSGGSHSETGVITFDSDATVEVPTLLKTILSFSYIRVVSGATTAALSIDETATSDGKILPVNGFITVDAESSGSGTYLYEIKGY